MLFTKIFAEFPSSRQIEGRNLSEKDQEVSNSEVSSKRVTKSECCNIQERVEENSQHWLSLGPNRIREPGKNKIIGISEIEED